MTRQEYLVSELTGGARVFSRLRLTESGALAFGWSESLTAGARRRFYARFKQMQGRAQLSFTQHQGSAERIALYRLERDASGTGWQYGAMERPGLIALEACDGYRIGQSRTHGLGVLAMRDYAPGDTIAVLRGEIGLTQSRYSARLTDRLHIEPTGMLRFLNHCCEPNARINAENAMSPCLVAIDPIEAGDEISFDYIENEGEIVGGFDCGCPAKLHRIR